MLVERVPMAVIGGRGPHGLALHLLLSDLGLAGVARLIDPSPEWLPLYAATGAAHAVEHLRSPAELGAPIFMLTRAILRGAVTLMRRCARRRCCG